MTPSDDRQADRPASPGASSGQLPTPPLTSEAAFHDAVERHSRAVHRYISARVGPEAAEDVLAETLVEAWRSRTRYAEQPGHGVEAWLVGIAHNIVARHRRAEQRWLRMCADTAQSQADDAVRADESELADAGIDAQRRARRLAAALSHIPRREREPLLLHVLQELSYEEIARILDIPVGTVRSRISRGRRRLEDRVRGGDRRG